MPIIKRTIFILICFLLPAMFLEIGLRLFNICTFAQMTAINASSNDWGGAHRYRYSKLFGYELIPLAYPEINSWGMRDKEYTLKKSPDTFRILLLGDSITENGMWSDYVEEKLNTAGKYEILNCGVRGWGLFQYREYLKNKGMQFNPDYVLIGLCLNDVGEWDIIQTILVDKKKNKTVYYYVNSINNADKYELTLESNPFLFQHLTLYRLWVFLKAKYGGNAHYHTNLSEIQAVQEMKHIANNKIYAIVFPYLKPLKEYSEEENMQYKNTISLLDNAGIEYLDLTGYFNTYGSSITAFRADPKDKIHYNDEANKLKSEIIYSWLKKQLAK